MAAGKLEDVMTAFYEGQYDILLSTTIVESGLGHPDRQHADRAPRRHVRPRPALSARGPRRPLEDPRLCALHHAGDNRKLTEQAERRLKVLQSLDTLGAGFQLASHDLDIRGAGNLLGDEQSGHIKEVGYELYQQMLEEAVAALKAGVEIESEAQWSPTIQIGAPVMIPEHYVTDLTLRLTLYKRLSTMDEDGEIAVLRRRAGRPLRARCRKRSSSCSRSSRSRPLLKRANVEKVEAGPKGIIVAFRDNEFANPEGSSLRRQAGHAGEGPPRTCASSSSTISRRPSSGSRHAPPADRPCARIAERKKAALQPFGHGRACPDHPAFP